MLMARKVVWSRALAFEDKSKTVKKVLVNVPVQGPVDPTDLNGPSPFDAPEQELGAVSFECYRIGPRGAWSGYGVVGFSAEDWREIATAVGHAQEVLNG